MSRSPKKHFLELGFARLDTSRLKRQGFPEAIYCQGKETGQIIKIMERLARTKNNILATRASFEVWQEVRKKFKRAVYNRHARTIVIQQGKKKRPSGRVLILSAGTADMGVAEEARVTGEFLGDRVEAIYDVGVAGLHRLLEYHRKLLLARVIIVVAGMEGALPGVVGGLVKVPVIGVPTSVGYGSNFKGVSALLGMLNSCSANVTVVNIDNGFGAAVVAHLINKR